MPQWTRDHEKRYWNLILNGKSFYDYVELRYLRRKRGHWKHGINLILRDLHPSGTNTIKKRKRLNLKSKST